MERNLSLRDLHGAKLTIELDGEREAITGFSCDDWPECETCGDLDEELVSDEKEYTENGSEAKEIRADGLMLQRTSAWDTES